MDAPRFLTDHFLIALPTLADPNFSRAVTLICQHTEEGAMGLTVNRASEYRLGDVLEQMKIGTRLQALAESPVLLGGPVQPERGFVLHEPCGDWESSFQVSAGLCVTTSRDVLAALARGEGPTRAVVTLGYAGWVEGQLEQELAENAWLTVASSSQIIFETPLEQRWAASARLMGVEVGLLTDYSGHA
ncbi:MAG TPA: YqgE/AlgH family protein [Xanthomonadaceae bacterium]|nr:YqgE/AlgH family protein [Xanthomonadaceae bacterium]